MIKTAREVMYYNGAANDYDLDKDPRCLWGWGPPFCHCSFGHGCFRELGHPGNCCDGGESSRNDLPCQQTRRPKDWDTEGRAATINGLKTGIDYSVLS